MAQFIAFEEGVEVNGRTILSIANTLPLEQETKCEMLYAYRISKPSACKWYPQQACLDVLKGLSEKFGDHLLFQIGKAIPEHTAFSPKTCTLEDALYSIDPAYHLNHRGGEIGSYRLVAFNEKEKKALMVCQTPYPSEFDRGIISAIMEMYATGSSAKPVVYLDTTKASRTNGSHSCTYKLFW